VTRTNALPSRVKNAALRATGPDFDHAKAIEDALILEPELPSIQLAEKLTEEAMKDPKSTAAILQIFFLSRIKTARKIVSAAKHEQYRLPGFEHLPFSIRGEKKEKLDLLDANYSAVRAWFKRLNTRRKDDPEFNQAKALVEKMRAASKIDRGVTVRRVFGLS
jgi:hypothetical protein